MATLDGAFGWVQDTLSGIAGPIAEIYTAREQSKATRAAAEASAAGQIRAEQVRSEKAKQLAMVGLGMAGLGVLLILAKRG